MIVLREEVASDPGIVFISVVGVVYDPVCVIVLEKAEPGVAVYGAVV